MLKLIRVATACFRDLDEMRLADCARLSPLWVTGVRRDGWPIMHR